MRRFMLFVAAAAFFLTASAGAGAASASSGTPCVSTAAATYRHSFNGAAGTVTITSVRPLCGGRSQAFSLASYTAPASSSPAGQFVYDSAHASISSGRRSLTLKVAVPACDTRVYAVFGSAVINETTSGADVYGTTQLGSATGPGSRSTGEPAAYGGGGTACATAPEVTFTNACDGTLTAALSNDANANARAVFVTGGRLIRVAPGHSTDVSARNGATITIRASSFTTYVGTWRTPVTGCTAAAIPARTVPATTAPPAAVRAVTAMTSPAPSASAWTPNEAAEAPGALVEFHPAALATDKPKTDLAQTGMGTGSVLAIALGLLMVGGGIIALTRVIRTSRDLA